MKNEKKVKYTHIGEVLYRRNPKARNLAIRINSYGDVKVTVPGRCSFRRAESFVLQKQGWISRKIKDIRQRTEENFVWQAGDLIKMRNSHLEIIAGETDTFVVSGINGSYRLDLPAAFDVRQAGAAEQLKEQVAVVGLKEAKAQLPEVLDYYAERFRLPYRKVSVRRMRTRWGSCSGKNNISLTSGLIFLPEHLIEYICLHELVHTIHKNHSREFWNALVSILPDAMQRRKELRALSIIA